jgi:hypothetical protein
MNNLDLYDKVKNSMETGDMILWSHDSIVGDLIEFFSKSDKSHASAVLRLSEYEGVERRRFNIEAVGDGVIFNLLSKTLAEYDGEAWWYPLLDSWKDRRREVGENILKYVGTPYDFIGVGKQIAEEVEADTSKLWCSELLFVSYGFKGIVPPPGKMPSLGIFKDPVKILSANRENPWPVKEN